MRYFLSALLGLLVALPTGANAVDSVYTDLAVPPCQKHAEYELGATLRCEGPNGYALLVHDDDARVSITVVTPDGKEYDLDYWSVVTRSFSALGPKAEWRLRENAPIALIVRVNAYEDGEDPDKVTSYLAVARIDADAVCVTDRIPPMAEQNVRARQAADKASAKSCLDEI